MLKTIRVGKYISVQGICVRKLPGGKMEVRVGDRVYAGEPVNKAA